MKKLLVVAWLILFIVVGGLVWLGNSVPENYDDSIVRQYKIVVNDETTINAKTEKKIDDSINVIKETIQPTEKQVEQGVQK